MRTRIETDRLLLRLPRLEDSDAWSSALDDVEVMRFIGGGNVAASQSIEGYIARWDANGFGQYAVERREDGAFIGRLGLLAWDSRVWRPSTLPDAGEAAEIELGWTLLRDYWGYGYATEAALAVREATWADLELKRLISLIHADNIRSIRVAERLGATPVEIVQTGNHGPAVLWVHPR